MQNYSKRIGFGVEYWNNLSKGISDTVLVNVIIDYQGFRTRFQNAELRANFSTSFKATAELSHIISDTMLLRLFAQYDIKNDTTGFIGLSFDIGSLTL